MSYHEGYRINHYLYGIGKIVDRGFEKLTDGMEYRNVDKDKIHLYM
jgi:hypothetical protein